MDTPATPPTPSPAQRGLDPAALMAIKNLQLRARVVMEGLSSGLHRSPIHGYSVEFTEYRPYIQGDDLRFLDWQLVARSDRYYIKKFEHETNLRCYFLVDNSRSMTFSSLSYTKQDYALTLAATLGHLLYHQGDAVGLLRFDEIIREYLPARHRVGQLRRLMAALEKTALGKMTDLDQPLQRIAQIVQKKSVMILISDLLAPIEKLEKNLTGLSATGHEIFIFQVLDPAERDFNYQQPLVFRDSESERELFLDPATARAHYLKELKAHNQKIQSIVQNIGASYQMIGTDQRLDRVLTEFLQFRSRRVRRPQRRGGTRGGAKT